MRSRWLYTSSSCGPHSLLRRRNSGQEVRAASQSRGLLMRFGGIVKTRLRDGIRIMSNVLAFGFAAALALALAIGANAAIWGRLDRALLQPLPQSNYFSQYFEPASISPNGEGFEEWKRAAAHSFPARGRSSAVSPARQQKLFGRAVRLRPAFDDQGDRSSLSSFFKMMSGRCANNIARSIVKR